MAQERHPEANPGLALDNGPIHRTAKLLVKFGDYFANPAQERFDDTGFRRGSAIEFPEIPGEGGRNRELSRIRTSFNRHRGDSDAASTKSDLSRQPSASGSIRDGAASGSDEENALDTPKPETSRPRRDTLEVPTYARRTSGRDGVSTSANIRDSDTTGQGSPAIVVSSNVDTPCPEHVLL